MKGESEKKFVLVTAGNTRVPIDKVRGIDNVFHGRTGTAIAGYLAKQGCEVTLLASHPELVSEQGLLGLPGLNVVSFRTFDDLLQKMEKLVRENEYDAIIHSAAVSDYRPDGVFVQVGEPIFIDKDGVKDGPYYKLEQLDSSGKIGSDHKLMWIRTVQTPKIVDFIREPWGFRGKLVKFKLQVGMTDEQLIKVATRSMHHSKADFIVANTFERCMIEAFIISDVGSQPIKVDRDALPEALCKELDL